MSEFQHPSSFIAATKQGSVENLYQITVQHPKTKRKFVVGLGSPVELKDAALKARAAAHCPGWKIIDVKAVDGPAALSATAKSLEAEQGPSVPLDELTDGEPNAVLANADLADPDYDPDKS